MGKLREWEDDLKDTGRKIDDEIFQPVKNTVESIVENPKALVGVALAVAFPGAGAALGSALGLGTGVAAQVAGQALINATINGGDVKAAVIGAVLPVAGKEIANTVGSTLAKTGLDKTVNTVITRAATQSATAAILGKDPLAAFVMGGVSAGVGAITGEIPGFKDLPAPAQNAISAAIGTKLVKGDVGNAIADSLIDDAIQWAKTEINKTPNAIKAAQARYKAETGQTLSDSQMATLLEIYGADGLPDAANKLFTTKNEAAAMWRNLVGTEPTEFDLMEIEGLDQSSAQRLTENRANTTTEEATQFLRDLYGANYTPTTDQLMELIGRPERAAEVFANNIYAADKNETTEAEALDFWKRAGFTEAPEEEQLRRLMSMPESAAESLSIRTKDIRQTTFNGSGYGTQENAQRAALAAGFNSYTWDGQDYTVRPTDETKKIEERKYDLVEQVLRSQGTTIEKATDDQLRGAMQKVNAVPTGMLGNATLQDIIKGAYSTFDADGTLRVEVTGAGATAESPNAKSVTQQLPPGLALANESEVWGVDGNRNPNVEYMVLPDGTAAFVRQSNGGPVGDFPLRGFSLDELADTDPEAWLQMASQFDKKSDGGVGDYLAKTANSIMLGAYATGNQKLGDSVRQTLSLVTQGVGEQTANLAAFFTDRLGMDHNSAMAKAGKALQDWGAANQSKSTKDQEAAIINAVSGAKGVGEKIAAFAVAAKENPGGLMTMIAKEGVQEVLPLWAAKAAYRFGTLAAVSANTAVEALESWGAGTKETYDQARRMGFSDEDARVMASKVGLQSAVITTFTNGFGDNPLVKRIIGDTVRDSASGIAKAGAREGFTEYFDGLGSNAAQQYQLTGAVNWDQATTAATIGMGVGAGTSSGIMLGAAINNGAVVGRDAFGNNVTYGEFMSGAKQVDMNTLNMNTPVAQAPDGDLITLGGFTAMPIASGFSYDFVKSGLPSVVTNQNVILGKNALGDDVTLSQLMSGVTEQRGYDSLYRELLTKTADQRTSARTDYLTNTLRNMGYEPDVEELQRIISSGKSGTAGLTEAAKDYSGAYTSRAEAEAAYAALGLKKPTEEDVLKLVGRYDQDQLTGKATENINAARYNSLLSEIGTQGRAANQSDIDALNQMLGGQRSVDLRYDVTGDKQITQADIDFLTQVVGGVKTDWTAPQQSPWAATGLYGQIQANELQRQRDLADAEAQRLMDQQAAAEAARKAEIRSGIRATAVQGQQQLQNIQQQLPEALRMAQEVSTPIYGQMGPYLDVGSELDFGFFKPSPEKQAATKQQQPTKIAAGGYIDDLLAGDMTADDLLNLLR